MADENSKPEESAKATKTGGKSKKALIFVLLAVVIGGVGFASWRFFMNREGTQTLTDSEKKALELANEAKEGDVHGSSGNAAEASGHGAKTEKKSKKVVGDIELRPIMVNLRGGKKDFVRIQFYIRPTSLEAKAKIERAKYPIQDALIMLVSAKSRATLESEMGLTLLKREIMRKVDQLIGPGNIEELGLLERAFQTGE